MVLPTIANHPQMVYNTRHSNGALHSLVVRLLWEQNVGGSNPLAPTILNPAESENGSFCEYAENRKSPVIWGFFVFPPLAKFSPRLLSGGKFSPLPEEALQLSLRGLS